MPPLTPELWGNAWKYTMEKSWTLYICSSLNSHLHQICWAGIPTLCLALVSSSCSCTGKDHPAYLCALYLVCVHTKGQPVLFISAFPHMCLFQKASQIPPHPAQQKSNCEKSCKCQIHLRIIHGKKGRTFSLPMIVNFAVHQFCVNIEVHRGLKFLAGAEVRGGLRALSYPARSRNR